MARTGRQSGLHASWGMLLSLRLCGPCLAEDNKSLAFAHRVADCFATYMELEEAVYRLPPDAETKRDTAETVSSGRRIDRYVKTAATIMGSDAFYRYAAQTHYSEHSQMHWTEVLSGGLRFPVDQVHRAVARKLEPEAEACDHQLDAWDGGH